MRFQDKVVFVTGGAIGLGLAIARGFAAEGAAVVIADIDDRQADVAIRALSDGGARAIAVHCDVSRDSEVKAAVASAIAQLGGIDALFNNAGLHLTKYNQPFGVLGQEEVHRLFDVNVHGVVNCTLACQASMRERGGGAIVNISSTSADFAGSPYGVSKLAVQGLTVALAKELAADNIRVNAIAPGFIATENAVADYSQEFIDDMIQNQQMIHRLGTMDDIVATALYLCSDSASFVTSETLRVSGGFPQRL